MIRIHNRRRGVNLPIGRHSPTRHDLKSIIPRIPSPGQTIGPAMDTHRAEPALPSHEPDTPGEIKRPIHLTAPTACQSRRSSQTLNAFCLVSSAEGTARSDRPTGSSPSRQRGTHYRQHGETDRLGQSAPGTDDNAKVIRHIRKPLCSTTLRF